MAVLFKFDVVNEINFAPFGYVLCEDSIPPHDKMVDITSFGNFPYGKEVKIKITTMLVAIFSFLSFVMLIPYEH